MASIQTLKDTESLFQAPQPRFSQQWQLQVFTGNRAKNLLMSTAAGRAQQKMGILPSKTSILSPSLSSQIKREGLCLLAQTFVFLTLLASTAEKWNPGWEVEYSHFTV